MGLRSTALISILTLGLLAGPVHVTAQQTGKVYRIGILTGGSASSSKPNIDPFREALRELGYVEGKNVVIEYRHADRKRDRLPELAAELVGSKVDVILATGTRPVAAAKQATSTIPIIAGGASDLGLAGDGVDTVVTAAAAHGVGTGDRQGQPMMLVRRKVELTDALEEILACLEGL